MKEINVSEAHISKKNQIGIYKILHGEGIYEILLLTGYNNGDDGKRLKAKNIRELKLEAEKIKLGLTSEEIAELEVNAENSIEREKEKHLLYREERIEGYYEKDLPKKLMVIDECSNLKWRNEIQPELEKHKASEKPMYAYVGYSNYTQYKYAYRKIKGIRQSDIALYEMKKVDRLKLVKGLVENKWKQAMDEIEKLSGEILAIKYLIVNEVNELIGFFQCENGDIFLKSKENCSILDSPYQFIKIRG